MTEGTHQLGRGHEDLDGVHDRPAGQVPEGLRGGHRIVSGIIDQNDRTLTTIAICFDRHIEVAPNP